MNPDALPPPHIAKLIFALYSVGNWQKRKISCISDFTISNKGKTWKSEQVHTSCKKTDNHLCFSGTSVCEECKETVKTTKTTLIFPVPLISLSGYS